MELQIDTNFAELPQWLTGKVLKQVKFASSVALYDTAKEVQEAVRADLPKEFTIRSPWVSKGIRIKPTSSKAIRNASHSISGMEVSVGTVDAFMVMQELGGVKEQRRKNRRLAIPKRNPQSELVDKKKWPKALLKMPGYFMWTRSDGRSFLFYRAQKARYPIELKYSFAESVRVPARWDLRKRAMEVALKSYGKNFQSAFDKAMATAR
ncbi:MAG: hypothetical protein Q4C86_07620 [bacterium]|nr:hypothetical protein [bacterium]